MSKYSTVATPSTPMRIAVVSGLLEALERETLAGGATIVQLQDILNSKNLEPKATLPEICDVLDSFKYRGQVTVLHGDNLWSITRDGRNSKTELGELLRKIDTGSISLVGSV
jgi:hypothetical protein